MGLRKTKLAIANELRKICEANCKEIDPHINPTTLAKLCAISSYCLTHVFDDSGFPAKIIYGWYISMTDGNEYIHCWCECSDEIWDITATQFDKRYWQPNPPVLRTRLDDSRFKKFREIELDQDELENAFWGWPKNQRPLGRNVDIILETYYDKCRTQEAFQADPPMYPLRVI